MSVPRPKLESIVKAPVIGEMEPQRVAELLREIGDDEAAADIDRQAQESGQTGLFGFGKPKPWQYTAHQIGFLAPCAPGAAAKPIQSVGVIAADPTLKNKRINVHLQRLRVYDYPGSGMHYVMLTFQAQNQLPNVTETVNFNQTYRVQEGQMAGVIGHPIFIGLNVGGMGAAFQVETINVKNDSDEKLLGFLESAPFSNGLNLLTTVQPVIKPLAEIACGLATMVVNRNKNQKVEEIYLGLDFQPVTMGARLAVGDYIVVQVPFEGALEWNDWQFDPKTGGIVNKEVPSSTIPFNYFVFSVTPFQE